MKTRNITLTLVLISIFSNACLSSRRLKEKLLGKSRFDSQCPVSEFSKLIPKNGKYILDAHKVTTSDGYILSYFRVRLSDAEKAKLSTRDQQNIGKPAHFQHGLNSDPTVYMSWAKCFPWYFVNHGYDLWLGNNRGTKFSTQTTNPKLSDKEFYSYSFEEMGLLDMTAYYKFLISTYKQPALKVLYIGHSEGTSQMFAALTDPSTKKFMRAHTERFFALAPIVYMTKTSGEWLNFFVTMKNYLHGALAWMGVNSLACTNCGGSSSNPVESIISGMITKMGFNFGSGSSVKSVIHYAQLIAGDAGKPIFRKYNYGKTGNQKKYGTATPPEWTFEDWETPLNLVVGKADFLGSIDNVKLLVEKLPAAYKDTVTMVPYNHLSFAYTKEYQLMYDIFDKALGESKVRVQH